MLGLRTTVTLDSLQKDSVVDLARSGAAVLRGAVTDDVRRARVLVDGREVARCDAHRPTLADEIPTIELVVSAKDVVSPLGLATITVEVERAASEGANAHYRRGEDGAWEPHRTLRARSVARSMVSIMVTLVGFAVGAIAGLTLLFSVLRLSPSMRLADGAIALFGLGPMVAMLALRRGARWARFELLVPAVCALAAVGTFSYVVRHGITVLNHTGSTVSLSSGATLYDEHYWLRPELERARSELAARSIVIEPYAGMGPCDPGAPFNERRPALRLACEGRYVHVSESLALELSMATGARRSEAGVCVDLAEHRCEQRTDPRDRVARRWVERASAGFKLGDGRRFDASIELHSNVQTSLDRLEGTRAERITVQLPSDDVLRAVEVQVEGAPRLRWTESTTATDRREAHGCSLSILRPSGQVRVSLSLRGRPEPLDVWCFTNEREVLVERGAPVDNVPAVLATTPIEYTASCRASVDHITW
jgi:hypothetical protein